MEIKEIKRILELKKTIDSENKEVLELVNILSTQIYRQTEINKDKTIETLINLYENECPGGLKDLIEKILTKGVSSVSDSLSVVNIPFSDSPLPRSPIYPTYPYTPNNPLGPVTVSLSK